MLVMRAGTAKVRVDELAFTRDGSGLLAPALSAGLCYWPSLSSGAKSEMLTLPAKVVRHVAVSPDAPHRYCLHWSGFEPGYVPKTAEQLAAAREKRQARSVEREAEAAPLFFRPDTRGRLRAQAEGLTCLCEE